MKTKILFPAILLFAFFALTQKAQAELQFYGLYGDLDNVTETAAWSNIVILRSEWFSHIKHPNTIPLIRQNQMKASIMLNTTLFEACDKGKCLRSDYVNSWNNFINQNAITDNLDAIHSFYIFDEPTWKGITYTELKSASDLVKNTFPSIPTIIIEAYPAVSSLKVPLSIDIIGFDRYCIHDPSRNALYQADYATLKSKRSNNRRSWWSWTLGGRQAAMAQRQILYLKQIWQLLPPSIMNLPKMIRT